MVEPLHPEHNHLLIRDIPPISEELMHTLTLETLRVKPAGSFDPQKAPAAIARQEGKLVTTFDIGGDKIARQLFQVKWGELIWIGETETQKGADGDTYIAFMQASKHTPFVSISCAGLLDGTILEFSPNAKIFTRQLKQQFNGDFARLFPNSRVSSGNDAVDGVKHGGIEAYKRNPSVRNVMFIINGGGFGIATLTCDPRTGEWRILASEPGHIEVPEDLNSFHRNEACQMGVGGATYTCIEKIIASGAGIEGTYHQVTGKKLNGHQIGDLMRGGDEFASALYDTSAIALAQVVYVQEKILGLKPEETTLVYHGGGFMEPSYVDRVNQVLERYIGQPHATFRSKEISYNAGLTGAAIASLVRE